MFFKGFLNSVEVATFYFKRKRINVAIIKKNQDVACKQKSLFSLVKDDNIFKLKEEMIR
jgi:hypothetical protein